MEDGYYWARIDNGPPEIVELLCGQLFRMGTDLCCSLKEQRWASLGETLDVAWISGPLSQPVAESDE